ncbi:MAG: MBL fold metallo-hydrolase [Rubrivivax sp.]
MTIDAISDHLTPDDARRAASLLLLRDSERGLEVLMLQRADRDGDMRSGVAVFPGGVLDPRDSDAQPHCLGPDDAQASATLRLPRGGLDYLVAAVRETFEEVGLLLAADANVLADVHAAAGVAAEVAAAAAPDPQTLSEWRRRLQEGSAGIADACAGLGLQLDLRGLVYFSHWLTPPGLPKRFDTRFFAAAAPPGQIAEADGAEALHTMWVTPAAALDRSSGLKLLPVTRETLTDLGRYADTDSALAAVRTRAAMPDGVVLTMPRRATGARGPRVVLPHELPYAEIGRLDPDGHGEIAADLVAGRAVRLSSRIVRVTAPNPGPMTGPGTNTYLVRGDAGWTVIDPGPVSDPHLQALLAFVGGESTHPGGSSAPISQILVTHTHRDHSPGAAALAAVTGAPVYGRRATHPQWQDDSFAPARELQHGERLRLSADTTLRVLHTPGHASNHLCFLLQEERTLITGDHVMQGSTVVINPPDGDMVAYLQSLHELDQSLEIEWLAPGHGFLVDRPHRVLRGLIAHRLRREAKVLTALRKLGSAAPVEVGPLLVQVYDDVAPALHPVAERSLLAHLLKLQHDGAVVQTGGGWRATGA